MGQDGMDVRTTTETVRLHVCTACRDAAGNQAGRALYEAMSPIDRVAIIPVECLSNCLRGCSAAISSDGKWGYLLGGLTPGMAADLADYARTYAASATGTVMPSRRAASLAKMICGRIPGGAMAVPRPRDVPEPGRDAA